VVYVAYYAGSFRVAKYGRHGLKGVGVFIDEGGNNFWGAGSQGQAVRGGKRPGLRSLYIFQYALPTSVSTQFPQTARLAMIGPLPTHAVVRLMECHFLLRETGCRPRNERGGGDCGSPTASKRVSVEAATRPE
jgi:hypothetical protein